MNIKVQLFAEARELAGALELEFDLELGSTVLDLKDKLIRDYPQLESLIQRSSFALNDDYGTDESEITEGTELAMIPPVSGG
ncbi:MAG: MoaD/ThiS family protein [Planctomycetota bacterium]